jgi:hypothetical protein
MSAEGADWIGAPLPARPVSNSSVFGAMASHAGSSATASVKAATRAITDRLELGVMAGYEG